MEYIISFRMKCYTSRYKNYNDLIKNYNLFKSYRVPLVLKELNTGCFQFSSTSWRERNLQVKGTKDVIRSFCWRCFAKKLLANIVRSVKYLRSNEFGIIKCKRSIVTYAVRGN